MDSADPGMRNSNLLPVKAKGRCGCGRWCLWEAGQHMHADLHDGLLARAAVAAGFNRLKNLGQFVAQEHRDDGGGASARRDDGRCPAVATETRSRSCIRRQL